MWSCLGTHFRVTGDQPLLTFLGSKQISAVLDSSGLLGSYHLITDEQCITFFFFFFFFCFSFVLLSKALAGANLSTIQVACLTDDLRELPNRYEDTEPARRAGSPRRRVTMTDVAREAGCSQATVSFVLNRNDTIKISPQTRDRVYAAARTLGYSSASVADLPDEAAIGTNR